MPLGELDREFAGGDNRADDRRVEIAFGLQVGQK